MKKWYIFECSDGSKWRVPVIKIAENMAKYYGKEIGSGGFEKQLDSAKSLFTADTYEIEDWARNNMNWAEVENFAERLSDGDIDMQEEWVNPEETDVTD